MRRAPKIVISVVFCLVLAACTDEGSDNGDASAVGSAEPIVIGYLAGTTGFCSSASQDSVAGARLAVERINAAGGVLGRPLLLEVRDDQSTPEVGVQQARDLVLTEGVKFLGGTCSSAVGLAVREAVADPSKILYVAPVADPAVFEDVEDSYVFGTLPTTTVEGNFVADWIKEKGFKSVSLLGEDYSYSYEVFDSFEEGVSDAGVDVASRDHVTGAADYSPNINKILSIEPEIVYNNLLGTDIITFTKQAVASGFFDDQDMIAHYEWNSLQPLGKNTPEDVWGYTYYPEAPLYPGEVMDEVAEAFKASTGRVLATGLVGDGYNIVWMIAQGIEMAGEVDPGAVAEALSGATIQFVQSEVTLRECDHLPVLPIALGKLAAPTNDQPYTHFRDVEFFDTADYYPPC